MPKNGECAQHFEKTPEPDGINRRDVLKGLLAGGLVIQLMQAGNAEAKEQPAFIKVVDERGKEQVPMSITCVPMDQKNKTTMGDNENPPELGHGTYQIAVQSKNRSFVGRYRCAVVDMEGKTVETFPMTYTAINNVQIDPGQHLVITMLPPVDVEPASVDRKLSAHLRPGDIDTKAEGKRVEMVRTGADDHHFGVTLAAENTTTKQIFEMTEANLQSLPPGIYNLETFHSRRGFPQQAQYILVDKDGKEVYRSDLVTQKFKQLKIHAGEYLRVITPPPVRPYNSAFWKGGPEGQQTSRGIVLARPYPSQDFAPGMFNGREQFNATPMAIAFWGEKACNEQPDVAEEIRTKGSADVRPLCKDPVLVLGARKVAADMAQEFLAKRENGGQDFRSAHHASFILQPTADGKIPADLLGVDVGDLSQTLEKHLIGMYWHNVHRYSEGSASDGKQLVPYANKTFVEDLAEARKKVKQWPTNSVESTNMLYERLKEVDAALAKGGVDAKVKNPMDPQREVPAVQLRSATLNQLANAIYRERQNYDTYAAEDIAAAGIDVEDRRKVLNDLEVELMKK